MNTILIQFRNYSLSILVVLAFLSCEKDDQPDQDIDYYTPPFHHEGIRLGANFNENIDWIVPEHLIETNTYWVRVFVNIMRFLQFDGNGNVTGLNENLFNSYTDQNILISLKENYNINNEEIRLIFSIKYEFRTQNMGVPEVGSQEFNHLVTATKRLLERSDLASYIDILVVGNEPMWETPDPDVQKLSVFTNFMINQVYNWRRDNQNWDYQIYAGALNRVTDINYNHPIFSEIFEIAKKNDKVEGIDIHSHIVDINEATSDITWIRDQGFDKEIIVTEFSLHRHFQSRLNNTLGNWGTENGFDPEMTLLEWLNLLARNSFNDPIDPEVFKSYFFAQNWYPRDWFRIFYKAFCQNNVKVATYGFRRAIVSPIYQISENNPHAWVINPYMNDALLGYDENGLPNKNPLFKDTWEEIVNGEFDCDN